MDFNTLDAQREAAEAYISSQRAEGWKAVKTNYSDGGYSGGNMDRPGLQALLDDIRSGQVDIVVVYKIDRLTRSLMDFAKLVEIFDAHDVTFVSVTQSFNTTTSMGRLTLNVLLSFAQFEREVSAERIRDKIAASKKKGLWMGGNPPLGYEVENRKLIVNDQNAEIAKNIFNLYLKLGCVAKLKKYLDENNIISPLRTSKRGNKVGGRPFSRGALYSILKNPIYIGKANHVIQECVQRIIIDQDNVSIVFDTLKLVDHLNKTLELKLPHPGSTPYNLDVPFTIKRGHKGTVLMSADNQNKDLTELPPKDLKNLLRGVVWRDEHFKGSSIRSIAKRENLSESGVRKIINRSFDTLFSL